MAVNSSMICKGATELFIATLTGGATFDSIGSLLFNPVIIIFDNQSTIPIKISMDGVNTWKTFSASEAIVLDLRAAHGLAANYTFQVGTTFYANGAAGALLPAGAIFSISYVYALDT